MDIPALLSDIKNKTKNGVNEAEAKALLREFDVGGKGVGCRTGA